MITLMNRNAHQSIEAGTVIDDKWVITEFISQPGMGEVYRARAQDGDRRVTLKILSRPWLSSLCDDLREVENCIERFRREVRTLAQVHHPNVLQVLGGDSTFVQVNGKETPIEYMVMEHTEYETLRKTMAQRGFYPDEGKMRQWILEYFLPLLDGIETLHRLGIIHRDLKPESIFLDGNVPKIGDFWLARPQKVPSLTRTFDLKGTPFYMSPEHFFDLKRTDERTDIYSLGKILLEAASGRPVKSRTLFKSTGLPKAETDFFRGLDGIIRKATSEDRDQRIPSVQVFKKALMELPADPALTGSQENPGRNTGLYHDRVWKVLITAVAVLAVIGGIILFYYLIFL